MELYKVADALVYLGIINAPEEMENISGIVIDPTEGLITVTFAAMREFTIDGDDYQGPGEDEPVHTHEPDEGMTLAEAAAEVERRSKLR